MSTLLFLFLVGVAIDHFKNADWFTHCMPITCIRRACPKCIKTRIKMYLALLYRVLIGPLLLLTNAYAGYGARTLNMLYFALTVNNK